MFRVSLTSLYTVFTRSQRETTKRIYFPLLQTSDKWTQERISVMESKFFLTQTHKIELFFIRESGDFLGNFTVFVKLNMFIFSKFSINGEIS